MTNPISETIADYAPPITNRENESATKRRIANRAITLGARAWYFTAVLGQLIFAYYVLAFYGTSAVQGNLEAWNKVLPHGYQQGDTIGNFATGIHVFLAVVVLVGGALQLIPRVRAKLPRFHRVNGRVYIVTAFILSLGGLFLVWVMDGGAGGFVQHLGVSSNALAIMLFATLAVRHAMAGNIKQHRQWALRLFIVMNGVWFFRIGLMLWLFVHKAPVGFDPKTFEGPFLSFLSFAQFLVPLAILELYMRVQAKGGSNSKLIVSIILTALALITGLAIFITTMGMWLPRM